MTGNVPDAVIENTHAHSSPPVTWSFQNGGRAPFAPMPGSATAGLSQRPKSTQRLGTRLRGRTVLGWFVSLSVLDGKRVVSFWRVVHAAFLFGSGTIWFIAGTIWFAHMRMRYH